MIKSENNKTPLKHKLEAWGLRAIFAIFRALPLDTASALGGFLARLLGRFFSANKTAHQNLAFVFPEKSQAEREEIIRKMWDNLGRTAAELAHLDNDELLTRINIIGKEYFEDANKRVIFFGGHIGNWELLACVALIGGRHIIAPYREANNKLVDEIITKKRLPRYVGIYPKGRKAAIRLTSAAKGNQPIGMLVDQKMNDGIAVPFFGREAMTAPAIAELALKYDVAVMPARVVRKDGVNFDGIVYPEIKYEKTGDAEKDIYNIMLEINKTLEGWIRERPEQWFWVHKRWPKE